MTVATASPHVRPDEPQTSNASSSDARTSAPSGWSRLRGYLEAAVPRAVDAVHGWITNLRAPRASAPTIDDFDRRHPRLVANLQAIAPTSSAYGPALRALARLGVLEVNAPESARSVKAEAELLPLLVLVGRIGRLERFVDADRIVIVGDDIDVLDERRVIGGP